MKKTYVFIIAIIVIGISGFFLFNQNNSGKATLGENFTPEEFWKYQFAIKKEKRKTGYNKADKPDEFTKYYKAITTKFGEEKSNYPSNYRMAEYNNAVAKRKSMKTGSKFTPVWEERGPGNVGGRTRGLIIDPDDAAHNTWFAGAATGGVWKTTDGGATWTCLTDEFPNLSANTLAMAASNTNVIFAGTGESFPGGTYLKGSGIFKSTNKGANWIQLASTDGIEDFEYVNRILIDPTDENIVIAATESGIMKSIDGGTTWNKVYSSVYGVEDLREDPTDFTKLYAAENSVGVIKSVDAGDTWTSSYIGMGLGDRFEIAVSPVNPAKIYASVNVSSSISHIYRSVDYGATWVRFEDEFGVNQNFLGGQGTYDNTIVAHPYNEDVVFFGGVNLWSVDFSVPGTADATATPEVKRTDLINTSSFLGMTNFGGNYLFGGMDLGTDNGATNITLSDFVSIEVRFGTGQSQKAHRFEVPSTSGSNSDGGAGVPAADYEYKDYIVVPFEVWDVTNNKQLMVSFRDQERDGKFNLIERYDAVSGREYLFVNLEDYSETASTNIAVNGGHVYKQMYFFWPTLAEGGTWDENALPDSKIYIEFNTYDLIKGTTYNVTDAYSNIADNDIYDANNFSQSAGIGNTVIPGVHPDHHNLVIVPVNEVTDSFLIVNANDGGLAISKNSGVTFNQLPNNYITTQFYGVAKKPGADEYIGGMQDNGTWRSKADEVASASSEYLFQIGGDGFECIWSTADGNKIIGSVYNNSFYRTTNGGANWSSATSGITSNDGPFISRLSTHKNTPDNLYAVCAAGIYKSTNFGGSWTKKTIGTGWLGTGVTAVTSQHNVEVSLANENIIWGGAAMAESNGWKIFVSTNQGETFTAVTEFADEDLSGYISGIATHPTEDSTAYLLFSFPGEPKVLRTKNLGQTWEDLSGFVGNSSSTNGFPDVVTQSLVVLPNDPSTIWVGTDIGLFESNDDGATWHYADNGIPAVCIYDMFVQDDQVVVATHGRGIWTATIEELNYIPVLSVNYSGLKTINANVEIVGIVDSIEIYLNNIKVITQKDVISGLNVIPVSISNEGIYEVKAKSYLTGNSYLSEKINVTVDFNPTIAIERITATNDVKITSTFKENYDSVQVYFEDTYYSSLISPTAEETNMIVAVTENGTFDFKIKGYINGIAYESNTLSMFFVYLGIIDYTNVNKVKVYPNPSNGYFTLEVPYQGAGNYIVEVFTLSGLKVYSKTTNLNNNSLNLEHLNSGFYLIKLEKNGKVYSQKIQIRK